MKLCFSTVFVIHVTVLFYASIAYLYYGDVDDDADADGDADGHGDGDDDDDDDDADDDDHDDDEGSSLIRLRRLWGTKCQAILLASESAAARGILETESWSVCSWLHLIALAFAVAKLL